MTDYNLAKVSNNNTTHQKPSLWKNDKYPEMPQLHAKSKVIFLDVAGPGVVTHIHTTRFSPKLKGEEWNWNSKYIKDVIIRIYYDYNEKPDIDMPFYDFLGDIEGDCSYYSTLYFSKVRRANNFRLLIPFKKHIKIEIENPTDISLSGLADIQYDLFDDFPKDMGYLNVAYVKGSVKLPSGKITLCKTQKMGHIIANWLQLECNDSLCKEGAVLCEGNDEFFIDGQEEPSLEYLGTEDCFGFSWGFSQIESDFYCAITKKEKLSNGGARIGLVRCRQNDRISFRESCKVVLDYSHEINPNLKDLNPTIKQVLDKGNVVAKVTSCIYYYSLNPED